MAMAEQNPLQSMPVLQALLSSCGQSRLLRVQPLLPLLRLVRVSNLCSLKGSQSNRQKVTSAVGVVNEAKKSDGITSRLELIRRIELEGE